MIISDFTTEEVAFMHEWCLKYRDLVRSGVTPSAEQSRRFMLYQRVCYVEGIAHGL
jgi:hypothetical protein